MEPKGGISIYAIVETGGKQYRVSPGDVIDVDKLPAEEGSTLELDRVLLIAQGEEVRLGSPTIEGARVVASVMGQVKAAKVVVFKYKPKVRYRKKTGHRQPYTRLEVKEIAGAGLSEGG